MNEPEGKKTTIRRYLFASLDKSPTIYQNSIPKQVTQFHNQ
jgi:hypothetical protein